MSYWQEVKEVVQKGIDLAIEGAKGGAHITAEKGKDAISYVQLKKDLLMKQRALHDLLADVGDITCSLYKEKKDIYKDEQLSSVMKDIVDIENECKEIEQKISDL